MKDCPAYKPTGKHEPCNCFDDGYMGRLHCARCGHDLAYGPQEMLLREGVEDILRNLATYHDSGTILSRLRRLLDYEDASPTGMTEFMRLNTIYATHRSNDPSSEKGFCVLDGQAWPCDTRVVLDRLAEEEAESKVWRDTAVERTLDLDRATGRESPKESRRSRTGQGEVAD